MSHELWFMIDEWFWCDETRLGLRDTNYDPEIPNGELLILNTMAVAKVH
jgi:hypothetical protein